MFKKLWCDEKLDYLLVERLLTKNLFQRQSNPNNDLNPTNEIQERKRNRFPVEVFPLPIQQVITATNENLNFPIDFIGASL